MLETLMKMGSVQENYKVIDDYGNYMRTIEALIIDDADIQEKAIELADELELNYFYEEEGFFVIELSDYSKRETNKKYKVEEVIEMKENFPIDGEAYAVGKANNLYFFAWGPEYPYADEVPSYEVTDGASGIKWHNTKKEALAAMNEAVEAAENKN